MKINGEYMEKSFDSYTPNLSSYSIELQTYKSLQHLDTYAWMLFSFIFFDLDRSQ